MSGTLKRRLTRIGLNSDPMVYGAGKVEDLDIEAFVFFLAKVEALPQQVGATPYEAYAAVNQVDGRLDLVFSNVSFCAAKDSKTNLR